MTGKRHATFVSVVFLHPSLATLPILLGSVWFRPESQGNASTPKNQKGHLLTYFVGQSQCDRQKMWFVHSLPLQNWKTPVVYLSSSYRRKKVSRGLDCSNAVCVSPNASFWTRSQNKNIVWLPAFTSTGPHPNFVPTGYSEVCCWSSWNPLLQFSFESCRFSAFWQSRIVVMPKTIFNWNCLDHPIVLFDIPTKLYVKFLRRPINFPRIFSGWAGCFRTLLVDWW